MLVGSWKPACPSFHHLLHLACPSSSSSPLLVGVLGDICEGLYTRGSCALPLDEEDKVWQGSSKNHLVDSPFCQANHGPSLPRYPLACVFCRSCAYSSRSASCHYVFYCCHPDEESDCVPVLLDQPILASCRGAP